MLAPLLESLSIAYLVNVPLLELFGAEPTAFQIIMAMFESPEHFMCRSIFDGNGIDKVAISVKYDKQIFVDPEGGDWITTWENSSNEVLEFLVRRSVDDLNGDMSSKAHGCPWCRGISGGIVRWQLG